MVQQIVRLQEFAAFYNIQQGIYSRMRRSEGYIRGYIDAYIYIIYIVQNQT